MADIPKVLLQSKLEHEYDKYDRRDLIAMIETHKTALRSASTENGELDSCCADQKLEIERLTEKLRITDRCWDDERDISSRRHELLNNCRDASKAMLEDNDRLTTEVTRRDKVIEVVRAELKKAHRPHADSGFAISDYPIRQAIKEFDSGRGSPKPPYGLCPRCGEPGVSRERRPNGNDKCRMGHTYPSKDAVDGRES